MKRIWILGLMLALVLTAVGAPVSGKHYSGWSAPRRIDELSTLHMDSCPNFTKDGLTLYFVSYDSTTGTGKRDLYVSQRASQEAPWGLPQKLGANINTIANEERCPFVTPDGRRLIFVRHYFEEGVDKGKDYFYMSIRHDKKDVDGWDEPVRIDALSSSTGMDTAGWGFENEDGNLTFYFGSNRAGTFDIYQTTMDSDGNFTPPVLVKELNDSVAIDYFPTVRKDGLEMYLISNRNGSAGGSQDIWVSTRNSISEEWATPVNLGPAVNSTANEWRSALSWDGMNMIFASNVTGNYDLYTSERFKVTGKDK